MKKRSFQEWKHPPAQREEPVFRELIIPLGPISPGTMRSRLRCGSVSTEKLMQRRATPFRHSNRRTCPSFITKDFPFPRWKSNLMVCLLREAKPGEIVFLAPCILLKSHASILPLGKMFRDAMRQR